MQKLYNYLLLALGCFFELAAARTLRNDTVYPAQVIVSYDDLSGDDEDVRCAEYKGDLAPQKNLHLAPCRVEKVEAKLRLPTGEQRIESEQHFSDGDDVTIVIAQKSGGEEAFEIREQGVSSSDSALPASEMVPAAEASRSDEQPLPDEETEEALV